jgi:uncharacterized membrane protein YkvA (DUF1232 family)
MSTPPQKTASGLVQFFQTISLSIKLLRSAKVPTLTKVIPFLGLAYLIFPLDFIPDLIPGLGQLDDISILLLCLWAFMQLCPPAVVREMSHQQSGSAPEPRERGDVVDATYRVVNDEKPATPPTQQP